jgi:hypothetical protein
LRWRLTPCRPCASSFDWATRQSTTTLAPTAQCVRGRATGTMYGFDDALHFCDRDLSAPIPPAPMLLTPVSSPSAAADAAAVAAEAQAAEAAEAAAAEAAAAEAAAAEAAAAEAAAAEAAAAEAAAAVDDFVARLDSAQRAPSSDTTPCKPRVSSPVVTAVASASDTNSRSAVIDGTAAASEGRSPQGRSLDGSDDPKQLDGSNELQPTVDSPMCVEESGAVASADSEATPVALRSATPLPTTSAQTPTGYGGTLTDAQAHRTFVVLSAAERHSRLKALRVRSPTRLSQQRWRIRASHTRCSSVLCMARLGHDWVDIVENQSAMKWLSMFSFRVVTTFVASVCAAACASLGAQQAV